MSTSPTAGPRRRGAASVTRPERAILVPRQRAAPPGERTGRRAQRAASRTWLWLLVAALAIGAAWLGHGSGGDPATGPLPVAAVAPSSSAHAGPAVRSVPPPVPAVGHVRVRYEILGSSPAGVVTYTTGATGPVSEAVRVRLPWYREFSAHGGFVPSITAQGTGPISCRITVDGVELSSVTTSGGNADAGSPTDAVATCTGHALY